MSADNGYVIVRHPLGGFAAVEYFLSGEGYPSATESHIGFDTVADAIKAAENEWSEYGVVVSAEARYDD